MSTAAIGLAISRCRSRQALKARRVFYPKADIPVDAGLWELGVKACVLTFGSVKELAIADKFALGKIERSGNASPHPGWAMTISGTKPDADNDEAA